MPLRLSQQAGRALLVAALLVAAPAVSWAGESEDKALTAAKESFDQAEKSYALGKFDEALKQYERAFELKQLPAFLFNIGQCHRNLGNWERASFFYQGYLARDPKAKNRDKVVALIDQMNAKVKEQEEAKRAAAAAAAAAANNNGTPAGNGATSPTGNGNGGKPEVATPVPVVPPANPPPPTETPTYKKWWVWTIVGVAVVGGGVAAAMVATNPSVSAANLNGSLGGPIDATR